jgi:hypothetical protein
LLQTVNVTADSVVIQLPSAGDAEGSHTTSAAKNRNGEAPAATKETPRAKRGNDSVRVYIKYHMNDVATATIEDGDKRRIYPENRKNETGMSHRDFCAMFAEEIERDIGRNVKWSMEDV